MNFPDDQKELPTIRDDIKIEAKFLNSKDKPLTFDLQLKALSDIKKKAYSISLSITRKNGEIVYYWSDQIAKFSTVKKLIVEIENIFPEGEYTYDVKIESLDRKTVYGTYQESIVIKADVKAEDKTYWRPKTKATISGDK